MRRSVRAGALGAVLALALGACGGTDWNAAHTRPAPAVPTRAALARAAAAERPYADALAASTFARETWTNTSAATRECIATAVVHTYGTAAFDAAALGPNALRAPRVSLTALPDLTPAQELAMGAALQACRLGGSVAGDTLAPLHVGAPASTACLVRAIDTDPRARIPLVEAVLDQSPDEAGARAMFTLLDRCVDLATVLVDELGVDPSLRACVVQQLRAVRSDVVDALTTYAVNGDTESQQAASGVIGVAVNRCRPSAHTGFTVPSS